MITTGQIKAARAMLDLNQKQLADRSDISVATLNNIERGVQENPKISTINAIKQALEAEGIEFLTDSLSNNVGLCLKAKKVDTDNPVVLIIDDNKADMALYKNWLKALDNKNYQIIEAENAREGYDAYTKYQPHCIILDFRMQGTDGLQLLAEMKRNHVTLPNIIFVTGMHHDALEVSARSQGVHAYLNKQTLTKEGLYEALKNSFKE